MERSLAIIKPDAVARRLVGEIVGRFERKGLTLRAMKLMTITEQQARRNYAIHEGKPFYEPLVRFMTSGPVVAMVLEGQGAIAVVRAMLGATFGPDAAAGTIRGDFGMSKRYNLVHASDSAERAAFEADIFFDESEFVDYTPPDLAQVYDMTGEEIV
jgi:nucleoside-diphosphate kinase